MMRKIIKSSSIFLVVCLFYAVSGCTPYDGHIYSPGDAWEEVKKPPPGVKQLFNLKEFPGFVSISLMTEKIKPLKDTTKTKLDFIQNKLKQFNKYSNATMDVATEFVGDNEWEVLRVTIKTKVSERHQDFYMLIRGTTAFTVLYTSLDNYYERHRADLKKVLSGMKININRSSH
ncbi:MAG: hypothetical protein GY754_00265 [bacterium]|nr:hypothetical protein [bacterium]